MKWKQEIKESIKSHHDAEIFFGTDIAKTPYKIFIPLPLANEIKSQGLHSPLALQYLPSIQENEKEGLIDPIGDYNHQVTPNLIHRYPNRVLFLPTKTCPIICRFCFRKNILNGNNSPSRPFEESLNYLKKNPQINEVIFSGGDPFYLTDSKISDYLHAFSSISHLKYVRFHSRVPLVLPSRIDSDFMNNLKLFQKRFKRFIINIHINHETELFGEAKKTFKHLADHFEIKTQTVLLKGVNNTPQDLITLFESIIDLGGTPYYLHHPDLVKGGQHFFLPIEEGRKIYHEIRKSLPGWAIPQYVLDFPGGEGKIPLFNPEQYKFSGNLLTLKGEEKNYPFFFFTN